MSAVAKGSYNDLFEFGAKPQHNECHKCHSQKDISLLQPKSFHSLTCFSSQRDQVTWVKQGRDKEGLVKF